MFDFAFSVHLHRWRTGYPHYLAHLDLCSGSASLVPWDLLSWTCLGLLGLLGLVSLDTARSSAGFVPNVRSKLEDTANTCWPESL